MSRMTLGEYIRSLRTQNHLTQASLAEMLHITDKAVSKWERDISCPDISLFPRLADILGVTVSDLLRVCVSENPASRLLQVFQLSHDIRTPIHIILGCADLIRSAADDPQRMNRYIDAIRTSGQYLLERYEEIHKTAQKGTPDGTLKPEDLDAYFRRHTEKPASRQFDFSGKRILIVEDIELNREIAGEIIKQTGAEVEYAEDGAICLEKLENAPDGYFDMILMDLSMPNMDGFEATRRIRRMDHPGKSRIPIIAVSANVREMDRSAATAAGMNAFTEKPINIDSLYDTMSRLFETEEAR
ncbi:MAG: response regulator [Clostridia bacterium]|nr:response regulator [Clostridia bacterium]